MKKTDSAFIDTDIIIKLGLYRKEPLLEKILCSFEKKLYVHEYIAETELVDSNAATDQLNGMIKKGNVTVLRESDLSKDQRMEYQSTLKLLTEELKVDLKTKRGKNRGEALSMAMAFAMDSEYFISDDHDAAVVAKRNLQYLDGTSLQTIRMRDIILHLKANESNLRINRKEAKKLYLYTVNPKNYPDSPEKARLKQIHQAMKQEFEEKLWPI